LNTAVLRIAAPSTVHLTCPRDTSEKKFGFGLEALDLLTVNVGFARQRSKIVIGTVYRVTLSE
jgi:hypothetical protein